MAQIYRTTLEPGKLDLVAAWLPQQPWYVSGAGGPVLERSGGFRLDDPAGEVGIEFFFTTDTAHPERPAYQVLLTYRAAPLDADDAGLIGTSEHGVLGRRWVYDGAYDPVAIAQLLLLIQGMAEPQAQSVSDTPDPTVSGRAGLGAPVQARGSRVTSSDATSTTIVVDAAAPDGAEQQLVLALRRRLLPGAVDETAVGHVEAQWSRPDGTTSRGWVVGLH